jgi:catechol 2,3-dioxygenase-like lactoylglutathione lyase family enzyme
MHLHHVAIAVGDMERSLAFYRDGLGLAVFQDEVIRGPDVDIALMEKAARVRMVLVAR